MVSAPGPVGKRQPNGLLRPTHTQNHVPGTRDQRVFRDQGKQVLRKGATLGLTAALEQRELRVRRGNTLKARHLVGGLTELFLAESVRKAIGLCSAVVKVVALSQFMITPDSNQTSAWLVALALSALIGAVTLTGSIVAWAKLQGYAEKAMQLPNQSLLRVVLGLAVLALTVLFVMKGWGFVLFLLVVISLLLGILLHFQ